ncbi:hypothetical protein JWS13_15370 [Rhodococcus pseudokoreensis]|uniref:Uncharacterized protein n=1 Tax=Rhodococcus pseudokoreensis TaxID=2811421 RepID=A0A974W278_9NOCA|nr:hypothetical protein [Rhodococcus pseudokoreensis]QSE89903.1 hypothetical protein JWS13_15370 [Rhodococcus pseudokoreensis]
MNTAFRRLPRLGNRARHPVQGMAAATAFVLCGVIAVTGTAHADPAQHSTETFTETFTFDGPVTCDGGPIYTLTDTLTVTDDIVTNSGGRLHVRTTLTQSITGIPLDPSLPEVTATSEGHGISTTSPQGAAAQAFVGTTTAKYSDGTQVTTREVDHVTVTPDRRIHAFSRCN